MPFWLQAVTIFILAPAIEFAVHRRVFCLLQRLAAGRGLLLRSLVTRSEGPGTLASVVIASHVAMQRAAAD